MTPLRAEEDPPTDTPPPVEVEIDLTLGEQTDEMFEDLLNQLQVERPEGPMGIDPYALCDIDSDHDCDEVDRRRFQTFLGRCKDDTGFTLAVSRVNVDDDDCVTKADEYELFPASELEKSP